jgi:hypothetical protein
LYHSALTTPLPRVLLIYKVSEILKYFPIKEITDLMDSFGAKPCVLTEFETKKNCADEGQQQITALLCTALSASENRNR